MIDLPKAHGPFPETVTGRAPLFCEMERIIHFLGYGFFDYKHDIPEFESDLFCTEHIIYIVLVYLIGFFGFAFLKRCDHDRISKRLKVFSILMVLFEITKITWESWHDISHGFGFNYEGILPVYTCSLFIYTLLAAAWGRGKVREAALAFITTVGLVYGAVGVVYCNGLNFYPFWTFGAFYSMFFHSAMFLTGTYLLFSGYKTLGLSDVFLSFIPIMLLAVVAIPIDYALGVDYMLIYSGSGVPLYEDLAASLAEKGARPVYTLIMLATHLPIAAIVVEAYKLIRSAVLHSKN